MDLPEQCARCGAPAIVPVVYGMPDEELDEAASRGEVVLGGCIVPQPQRWGCRVCGYMWPLPYEALASDLVGEAFALAAAARRGRHDLDHPVEVAHLLYEEGYGETTIAAGLLHDVFEHACIGRDDIEARFGPDVAELVDVLAEQAESGDYDKRKLVQRAQVTTAGRRAAAIYAADRLTTLRQVRRAYAEEGECVATSLDGSLDELLVNAERDVRMLERFDPPLPFREELRKEAEALCADRVASRRKGPGREACKA